MESHRIRAASTTDGLPVAPSMGPGLEAVHAPHQRSAVDRRTVAICAAAIALAMGACVAARLLTALIALITNLAFHGRPSLAEVGPATGVGALGLFVVVVPVIGALIVGVMARYGSVAIRGHGIPEAMERILLHDSRIPVRLTFLKPLSAAVAIGTGGPFGAEGPIIATGGALGSALGQFVRVTAEERKTLLAAGAAAGMTAIFGSPVAAVLLAIELLLFEFRPRSVLPVALAATCAGAVRFAASGGAPVFAMPAILPPGGVALAGYVGIGAVVGLGAVVATRAIYAIEDRFERLPIHWMWWPALGAIPVGLIGWFVPRTLGVGYDNISDLLAGHLAGGALAALIACKFASWSIYLGSGTSGGTLAPLFTFGGGLGALLAAAAATALPSAGIDPRIGALVGMAAMFAGASRALLTSVVFAFETTRQPLGLLPLLGGCTAAYLVSALLMKHSIMTEKIARRGTHVPFEYEADFLGRVAVREVASATVVALRAEQTVGEVRRFLASGEVGGRHQGFPIVDGERLVGVITRRDLDGAAESAPIAAVIRRAPVVVFPDSSLRDAADQMVSQGVGRLAVVERAAPTVVVAMLSRSDVIGAHARRLAGQHGFAPPRRLPLIGGRSPRA